jgi:outer membrane receptor protein involved in Fe transport
MNFLRLRGRTGWLAILVPVLVLAVTSAAWAQRTDGEIQGSVRDTTMGSIPGAAVVVTNVNTGYTRAVTSDTRGDFVFVQLQPGEYRLEITADGFKVHVQTVRVSALTTAAALIQLEVGDLTETVEVTAEAAVNVTRGGVQESMTEEVLDFPTIGRYGFANAALFPAINQKQEGDRKETINASVAGNVASRNTFYIDGAEATDPWRGWSPRMPTIDAFDEIVVNTAGAQVDVGANFGGTYNAIFKSGSNNWHGGAWYFFGEDSLNANSWQNNRNELERPPQGLTYWGVQGGGPIVKDKLFFYATLHRENDAEPYTTANRFAPTPAMIGGDFSALPYTIYNPDTGQPFPGNVIPQSMLDPVAVSLWDTFGYSQPGYSDDWAFQFQHQRKVWNVNGRVDWALNNQHRLTVSGYWYETELESNDARVQSISGSATGGVSGNTFSSSGLYGEGGTELSLFPQTVINAKWTWMAKPSLFIETHFAWSDMPEQVVLNDAALGTTMASLGSNDPLPRPDAPEMMPSIAIGNWWGDQAENGVVFNGWTTDFWSQNLAVGSSATWLSGAHTVKLGFEFQKGLHNRGKPARQDGGSYEFNGNASSNNNPSEGGRGAHFAHGFADLMMGRFNYYGVEDSYRNELRSQNLGVYIMDTWRVSPRLTLTGGLRWEHNSGISERDNILTYYRPGTQSTVFPTAPSGIQVPGDPGVPDTLSGSFNKISPRLNFAYDLKGDGKTAIRGSVGQYYGRDSLALWESYYYRRPPYVPAPAQARNGLMRDPWLTSQSPTYTTVPLPFTDYDPNSYVWPSQVGNLSPLDPDYTLPSSWQWNVAIEREIRPRITLEVGYQGNSSSNTPTGLPTNVAVWQEGANDGGSNVQSRRPDSFLANNGRGAFNVGRLRFDQLQVITRARRAGLFGQLAYNYTHARRNYGGTDLVQGNRDWDSSVVYHDNLDLLQTFQHQHSISGFLLFDLPLYSGDKSGLGWILLDDWQMTLNGFWNFGNKGQSVSAGFDSNADGEGNDRAMVTGDIQYPKTELNQGDLLYQWFDPGAFRFPNGTTERDFSPNVVYDGNSVLTQLPGAWRVDASLMKTFLLGGDFRLQFRFETFNLFNHPILNWPNGSLTSSDFGKVRGKSHDARRVQMGIRLMF